MWMHWTLFQTTNVLIYNLTAVLIVSITEVFLFLFVLLCDKEVLIFTTQMEFSPNSSSNHFAYLTLCNRKFSYLAGNYIRRDWTDLLDRKCPWFFRHYLNRNLQCPAASKVWWLTTVRSQSQKKASPGLQMPSRTDSMRRLVFHQFHTLDPGMCNNRTR